MSVLFFRGPDGRVLLAQAGATVTPPAQATAVSSLAVASVTTSSIAFTFTSPPAGVVTAEYRASGATVWMPWPTGSSLGASSGTLNGLASSTLYDVRLTTTLNGSVARAELDGTSTATATAPPVVTPTPVPTPTTAANRYDLWLDKSSVAPGGSVTVYAAPNALWSGSNRSIVVTPSNGDPAITLAIPANGSATLSGIYTPSAAGEISLQGSNNAGLSNPYPPSITAFAASSGQARTLAASLVKLDQSVHQQDAVLGTPRGFTPAKWGNGWGEVDINITALGGATDGLFLQPFDAFSSGATSAPGTGTALDGVTQVYGSISAPRKVRLQLPAGPHFCYYDIGTDAAMTNRVRIAQRTGVGHAIGILSRSIGSAETRSYAMGANQVPLETSYADTSTWINFEGRYGGYTDVDPTHYTTGIPQWYRHDGVNAMPWSYNYSEGTSAGAQERARLIAAKRGVITGVAGLCWNGAQMFALIGPDGTPITAFTETVAFVLGNKFRELHVEGAGNDTPDPAYPFTMDTVIARFKGICDFARSHYPAAGVITLHAGASGWFGNDGSRDMGVVRIQEQITKQIAAVDPMVSSRMELNWNERYNGHPTQCCRIAFLDAQVQQYEMAESAAWRGMQIAWNKRGPSFGTAGTFKASTGVIRVPVSFNGAPGIKFNRVNFANNQHSFSAPSDSDAATMFGVYPNNGRSQAGTAVQISAARINLSDLPIGADATIDLTLVVNSDGTLLNQADDTSNNGAPGTQPFPSTFTVQPTDLGTSNRTIYPGCQFACVFLTDTTDFSALGIPFGFPAQPRCDIAITAAGGGSGGNGYTALSGMTYAQLESWGKPIANNGDNYRGILAVVTPQGGTGPFTTSIVDTSTTGWRMTASTTGDGGPNDSKQGWLRGPGSFPGNNGGFTVQVKDALGATVTHAVAASDIDTSMTAACISVGALRRWPSNVVPICQFVLAQADGTTALGFATVVDPSGLWKAEYGQITTKSGSAPPVGSYPLTLQAAGYPDRQITMVVYQGVMGGIVALDRASVVSTAVPKGWPMFRVAGTTPFNSPVCSMDDTGGAAQIDPATGIVTVLDASKLVVGNNSFVVHQTEGTLTATATIVVPVIAGNVLDASHISFANVRKTMTNDEHNVSLGFASVNGISGGKWFLPTYTRLNTYAVRQHADFLAGKTTDDGAQAQFTIDPSTAEIRMPWWVDAGLDGTSTFQYDIQIACTDGTNTCYATLSEVVSWAPVSRQIYIGRGMKAAHGADGYEHVVDFRVETGSDIAPHTGTWHVSLMADADPEYYTNDTGALVNPGSGYARYAFPGPIVVEGIAANGVAQPRTGGPVAGNVPGGIDSRGKGNWTFGNGQAMLKNVEVSGVHGGTPTSGIEATRKDGCTYGSLSVIGCNLHDNDQGIETGNWVQGSLLVDGNEITSGGQAYVSSGATHNIYCGQVSYAEVKNNVLRHATVGHELKVRASEYDIHDNTIYDGLSGNASSCINLPDGGKGRVYANKIIKGAMPQVNDAVRYGEDIWKGVWDVNELDFHDNQVDVFSLNGNHWGVPTAVGHVALPNRFGVRSVVRMTNNSLWLAPMAKTHSDIDGGGNQIADTGYTIETGTVIRSAPMSIDLTTRPRLSGTRPIPGPFYRCNQWGGDNYANFDDAQQVQDREQIVIPASTPVGTPICTIYASNDLVEQGAGGANPWGAGTQAALVNDPVYYSEANPNPWRNDLFQVTVDGAGHATLKTAAAVPAGVYWAQLRLTAPNGQKSDWRYPVTVTA